MLEFRVLGPLEVRNDEGPLVLGGPRRRALLLRLLLDAGSFVSTDRLIDDLWGGSGGSLHSLHVYVSELRRAFGPSDAGALERGGAGYCIKTADGLDSARFEALVADARTALGEQAHARARSKAHAALSLWRGDAYADVAYEPWAEGEAARLQELRLVAEELRIAAELELGGAAQAVAELEPLVRAHRLRERLRYLMVLALYRAGRQADALEAYQDARRALVDELGIDPGRELLALERAILRQDPSLSVEAPPRLDLSRRHSLPAPPTALVGREQELSELGELLTRDDVRVVTLTGPGGSGKTRLAIAICERLLDRFESGVFFVSLLAADDATLVLPVIAQALGITDEDDEHHAHSRPLAERLSAALAERELLLVLDNFEHVLPAARHVAELLSSSPRLRVLSTSRASLRLRGEHEYSVSPLALPPIDSSSAAIAEYPSVRLFSARAREVAPNVSLEGEALSAVAEICRRLDGLPLALELAAARARLLPPTAMLARLEKRLDLLSARSDDVPARQRTLRDAIGWSCELLDDAQRSVFRQLGVFAGCTLEAAESVISSSPSGAGPTLDALEALLENSLIRTSQDASPERRDAAATRVVMLEVIREFALEQLEHAPDEAERVRRAHASYYVSFAESLEAQMTGSAAERDDAVARLEEELGNVRAALRFALDRDDHELGTRLTGALELAFAPRDDSIALLISEVRRMSGPAGSETPA